MKRASEMDIEQKKSIVILFMCVWILVVVNVCRV